MNINTEVKAVRGDNVLESLDEASKSMLVEIGNEEGLKKAVDFVSAVMDVSVSIPTMSRFLNRQRELSLIEQGDEAGANAEKLASRGKGETLRKGAMEALRQRMFEEAVSGNSAAAAALYDKLLREEKDLKQMALLERKAAQADENLRLQRERLRLDEVKAALELLPRALGILSDESLDEKARVAEARRCLIGWKEKAGAIEVGTEKLTEGNKGNEERIIGAEKR